MSDLFKSTEYLLIIAAIIGFSEIVSIRSKGYLSVMLIASGIFIVSFALGLPTDLFESSGFVHFGQILLGILIVHLGTSLNTQTVYNQWKSVVIALLTEAGIVIIFFFIGTLFLEREIAISSISPFGGGAIATLIVQKAAIAKELDFVVIYTTLMLAVSSFIGYPMASFFLKKEALNILKTSDFSTKEEETETEIPYKRFEIRSFIKFQKKYNSPAILIAKTTLAVFLGFLIAEKLDNAVSEYVFCLILGFLLKEIGFLESEILHKAQSYGFVLFTVMILIFSRFAIITPEMLVIAVKPLLISLVLGIFAILSVAFIASKILKVSVFMAFAIGIAAMFGFPGTYIIPYEVSLSVSKIKEEQDFIFKKLYPQMIIAGFISVTMASVVIAGFVSKLI